MDSSTTYVWPLESAWSTRMRRFGPPQNEPRLNSTGNMASCVSVRGTARPMATTFARVNLRRTLGLGHEELEYRDRQGAQRIPDAKRRFAESLRLWPRALRVGPSGLIMGVSPRPYGPYGMALGTGLYLPSSCRNGRAIDIVNTYAAESAVTCVTRVTRMNGQKFRCA
jgi:hypothetical protein